MFNFHMGKVLLESRAKQLVHAETYTALEVKCANEVSAVGRSAGSVIRPVYQILLLGRRSCFRGEDWAWMRLSWTQE